MMVALQVMPLPTQQSCCHRVAVIEEGLPPEQHSVVVSELASSKIFQMMIRNVKAMNFLVETREVQGEFVVKKYTDMGGYDSKKTLNQPDLERLVKHDDKGRPLCWLIPHVGLLGCEYRDDPNVSGGALCILKEDGFTPWAEIEQETLDDMSTHGVPVPDTAVRG